MKIIYYFFIFSCTKYINCKINMMKKVRYKEAFNSNENKFTFTIFLKMHERKT